MQRGASSFIFGGPAVAVSTELIREKSCECECCIVSFIPSATPAVNNFREGSFATLAIRLASSGVMATPSVVPTPSSGDLDPELRRLSRRFNIPRCTSLAVRSAPPAFPGSGNGSFFAMECWHLSRYCCCWPKTLPGRTMRSHAIHSRAVQPGKLHANRLHVT